MTGFGDFCIVIFSGQPETLAIEEAAVVLAGKITVFLNTESTVVDAFFACGVALAGNVAAVTTNRTYLPQDQENIEQGKLHMYY